LANPRYRSRKSRHESPPTKEIRIPPKKKKKKKKKKRKKKKQKYKTQTNTPN
jgi:hypothetical protein